VIILGLLKLFRTSELDSYLARFRARL